MARQKGMHQIRGFSTANRELLRRQKTYLQQPITPEARRKSSSPQQLFDTALCLRCKTNFIKAYGLYALGQLEVQAQLEKQQCCFCTERR